VVQAGAVLHTSCAWGLSVAQQGSCVGCKAATFEMIYMACLCNASTFFQLGNSSARWAGI